MKKHYYVYYSYEEWGRGYIGKRECTCPPDEDTNYFGSYKDKSFKPREKIILFICELREEAYKIEELLHNFFQVNVNPHFANRSKQTSSGFSFSAEGERNPNYGGGRMSKEAIERIAQSTSKRLKGWTENPFRKKGSESMSHGRRWATNAKKTEEIYLKPGEEIPKDWLLGRKNYPPRSEESKAKVSNSLKGKSKSDSHKDNLRKAALEFYKKQSQDTHSEPKK